MHFIFCVSGFSGVGKDEFCNRLSNSHGAIHTGLADPAKRHMADTYGFTKEQLFGPSQARNAGDKRHLKASALAAGAVPVSKEEASSDLRLLEKDGFEWWMVDLSHGDRQCDELIEAILKASRECVDTSGKKGERILTKRIDEGKLRAYFKDNDPIFFLSPREALQEYCALMNSLCLSTWIRHGVDLHRKLARSPRLSYDRMEGLVGLAVSGSNRDMSKDFFTCFSDFRHWHEIKHVREEEAKFEDFKPVLVRIKRPGIEAPPFSHKSEMEQLSIPDSEFDFVIDNCGSIEDLWEKADIVVSESKRLRGRLDFVPPSTQKHCLRGRFNFWPNNF
jgi:hypothetical protein